MAIPAGGKAVYAHYVSIGASQSEDAAREQLESIYDSPDMDGLSADEIHNIKNSERMLSIEGNFDNGLLKTKVLWILLPIAATAR